MIQPFDQEKAQMTELAADKKYQKIIDHCEALLNDNFPQIINSSFNTDRNGLEEELDQYAVKDLETALFFLSQLLESSAKLNLMDDQYHQRLFNLILIAEEIRSPVYCSYGYNRKGKDLFAEKEYQESAKWFIRSLEIENNYRKEVDELLQPDLDQLKLNLYAANFRLGRILSRLQNFDESISYFRKSVMYSQQLSDIRRKGLSEYQLGNTFFRMELYDSALYFYENAKQDFNSINDFDKLSAVFRNIGNAYNMQKKPNLAIVQFDSAGILLQQTGDTVGFAYLLNNLANLHYN